VLLKEEAMMDRERPSASELEGKIPEAWIGLEDVNDRGVVMLVTRHRDQNQFSRYFYPWSVVGWIRLAEEDEQEQEPRATGFSS
jgi:hypothetical protein